MLKLRCFGCVEVVDDDGNARSLRSRKHLGLLVYLVSHPRTVHSREDLSELLWNGDGPRERHSLSQALYDVRSNVDRILDVSTTSVRLIPARIEYEAESFERAVESGDHETALDLYRAEFAPALTNLGADSFDRWIDGERERHRVLASLALRNAQRAAEERGDWDRMCLAALRLIRMNEFDEEAHCALMRGLWLKGDPASALRHYRSVDPGLSASWTSVHPLVRRMESSGAVKEVLTVPRQPVELIGREREFAELTRFYRDHHDRGGVIVVTGERGVGKTALLGEFARVVEARGGKVAWSRHGSEDLGAVTLSSRGGGPSLSDLAIDDPGEGTMTRLLGDSLAVRPGMVLVIACRDYVNSGRRCGVASEIKCIHLDRLDPIQATVLVAAHYPEMPQAIQSSIARLAGGNPRLAVALARTELWQGASTARKAWSDEAVATSAFIASATLRTLTRLWVDDLSPSELHVSTMLAVLTQPARAFLGVSITNARVAEGLSRLADRGWIVRESDGPRLAHPFISYAIASTVDVAVRRQLRTDVAARLREGPPGEQLAAAGELLLAGRRDEATELASSSAAGAIRLGDTVVATRAAVLAANRATTAADRLRTGLLAAEAELTRGRPCRAEQIARQAGDAASQPEQRLEAQLVLLRALLAVGNTSQVSAEATVAGGLGADVDDDRLSALLAMQLAEVDLSLAVTAGSGMSGVEATKLERALKCAVSTVAAGAAPWIHALRSLFEYRMVYTSRSSAENLLKEFGPTLFTVTGSTDLVDVFRAVVELRAARLHNALDITRSILKRTGSRLDRLTAGSLNNLGVILTELGDLKGAQAMFDQLASVDGALRSPLVWRLHSQINQAQSIWFMSQIAEARTLCTDAVEEARRFGMPKVEADGTALLGLMAVQQGGPRVYELSERLSSLRPHCGSTQDQYLIGWFQAVMSKLAGKDVGEELVEMAERMLAHDALASAKLLCLAGQLDSRSMGESPKTTEAVRVLRSAGAGWFVRWVQPATSRMVS